MLKISLSEAEVLHQAARERIVETCAVGLVYPAGSYGGTTSHVVRDLVEVPEAAYAVRTATAATLKPDYCIEINNRARAAEAGVFIAHTHPGVDALQGFSAVDDDGERALADYFRHRLPAADHFAAVVTSRHIFARHMGPSRPVLARCVGRMVTGFGENTSADMEAYDRQVRALGEEGQRHLSTLRVAVVGLGGTGSVLVQMLAHLGVGAFLLIDYDAVELTNLNRLVGATPTDVGQRKVDVAAKLVSSINPAAAVTSVVGDVTHDSTARMLTEVDFIFGCTDSVSSRAVLNQFAYQYLVPFIDIGVGVFVHEGQVQYITGRTQMLAPGLPCLLCMDKLDANQVRIEMLSEEQRRSDPYITGASVPQPAVISLNSTISSAAVTMFLAAVTGLRSDARMLIYDGIRGSLRPAAGPARPNCIVCSDEGSLARGSTWQLPTRQGGDHA
ncbi:ThiF family adenylyltransferase [Ralstonia sp. TCR112]|nr:ThiF family adenylyltransferase [Ralstonia sp. TCR112]